MAETEREITEVKAPRVSVLMPTFRRPHLLPIALATIIHQRACSNSDYEVIVVDNCPDASARTAFESAFEAAAGRVTMVYRHEPRPGISHARNTALAAARGQYVLFLDDDQQFAPTLIARYLQALERTHAPILIGPVRAVFEPGRVKPDDDMRAYFSRRYEVPDLTDISNAIAPLGTNNALFDRRICFPDPEPFDPALGLLGGEDSLVFRSLRQRGLRFAWVAKACAYEFVPTQRQTQSYIRMRRFRSGQIRVLTCLRLNPPRVGDALLWMGIGAIQTALYLLYASAMFVAGSKRWQHMVSRAYGGAGKFLWMEPFQFPAYGAAARIAQ
jgi:Glycosyltransferases involved in cell wall biogenesis